MTARYPVVGNYFRLLTQIMDADPPSVPEGVCSDKLVEFVSLCLEKNEMKRPSANDLLKHHFASWTLTEEGEAEAARCEAEAELAAEKAALAAREAEAASRLVRAEQAARRAELKEEELGRRESTQRRGAGAALAAFQSDAAVAAAAFLASCALFDAVVAKRAQEAIDAQRAAKRRRLEEAAAAAGATERTTELTTDALAATLGHLRLVFLQSALCVCKEWRAAARITAHDPSWYVQMLHARELRAMRLPLSTTRRWVEAHPDDALSFDVRTLFSLGASRPLLLRRLDHAWCAEKVQHKSCVQINLDVVAHGMDPVAVAEANAALSESSDFEEGRAVASLERGEGPMTVVICGKQVGQLPAGSLAAPGHGRLMRHPGFSTWPLSMRQQYPFVIRTIKAEVLVGSDPSP